jgi:hypothetical protein
LTYTPKLRVRGGNERNFTTKKMIFPLWTFHLYVRTFQQHLHMEYISLSWSSGTRRVNLVTNQVICHEWGKDREMFTTSGIYPWSFVTQIFHSIQPCRGCDRKTFDVMTNVHQHFSTLISNGNAFNFLKTFVRNRLVNLHV